MEKWVKITRHIRRILYSISVVFITIATALAAVNSILRFVGVGFPWADELYVYLIVLMVYLALPQMEGAGDQLCISAIDSWIKGEKGKKILNYFRQIVTCGALTLLAYYGMQVMIKAFTRKQLTYILMLPKGILYAIAVISIAAAIFALLVIMIFNKGEFDDAS